MSQPPYYGSPQPPFEGDPPYNPGPAQRVLLLSVVAFIGISGVIMAAALGRLDSALLFVGIPCILALAIGLLPVRAGWSTTFQVITVVLLLCSALLHEGALCVLLASPLVYGTAALIHGSVAVARRVDGRRTTHLAVLPIVALFAVEGLVPALRISPEQQSGAKRVVAATCGEFVEGLQRGPSITDADRGWLLHVAQYPTPVAASGTGLELADTWTLTMPAGAIETEVVSAGEDHLGFRVVSDTARTTRWVDLHGGTLEWAEGPGGCVATMTIDYTRHLDPSVWFGPITDTFMDAGADAFLASLDQAQLDRA